MMRLFNWWKKEPDEVRLTLTVYTLEKRRSCLYTGVVKNLVMELRYLGSEFDCQLLNLLQGGWTIIDKREEEVVYK